MDEITDMDNLYLAYHKACKGKQGKREVRCFAEHFDENMQALHQELANGTIALGNYTYFTIYDPKERIICAAPFRERVVQHAIMNVCHRHFDSRLVDTTYATRKGKGVYAAINQSVKAMTQYEYSVKLDFRKFYDSVDHSVLKAKLRRLFKDAALLDLFDKIIDSYCVAEGKGIPIGNLTSQYFANRYLSDLDHRAKERWHAAAYMRYMDDILIAGNDREALKRCVANMVDYSAKELKLTFKPPIFKRAKDGQVFLGYKVMPYHYLLSGRSKRRFRSKLLQYESKRTKGEWSEAEYAEHVVPLVSFVQHADSKSFRRACMEIVEKGDNRRAGRTA